MKTYKKLYPQICSFEILYLAYRQAVADFEFNLEHNLLAL